MEVEDIKSLLKAKLNKSRYEHTMRVYEEATALAEKYGADQEEVMIAALFHDYYKNTSKEELKQLLIHYGLPESLLQYHAELWHGPVAAEFLKQEMKIGNLDVYKAIYYHTTGRAKMSLVEQIVFIADYIEPARSFPGVSHVRKLAYQNLDEAVYESLKLTIQYLNEKKAIIHPSTKDAFEYYKSLIRGESDE